MYLEHVNLTVSNLQRSIDFYRTLFGFDVRWSGSTSDGQPAAHVGDGRSYLALFQAVDDGAAETDYGRVGFNHFGLVVESLAETRERLRQLGVAPHFAADYEPGVRLYFLDPDGVEVELVEYNRPHDTMADKERTS